MSVNKNLDYDLAAILEKFQITDTAQCSHLEDWMGTNYTLNKVEETICNDLHTEIARHGGRMNEEEIKAKIVGPLFYVAKVQIPDKVMVFFERPIAGTVKGTALSVICDCMVASPVATSPKTPYFFLQEFKKKRGEKKDPEAQMLIAMLIAQANNNNQKPVHGGFVVGTSWQFAVLAGDQYCVSSPMEASDKEQLLKIVYMLRKIREIAVA